MRSGCGSKREKILRVRERKRERERGKTSGLFSELESQRGQGNQRSFRRLLPSHLARRKRKHPYNTIREIEYANRVLKTDLDLCPIYHKKDESSMAHLHLGLLAYWVVNTVRYQLKRVEADKAPIHLQWKEIVRIMNTQKAVTTLAQNRSEEIIEIRRCTYPTDKARFIYDKLGYRYMPYKKKKSVVHKTIFEKNYPAEYREFNSS